MISALMHRLSLAEDRLLSDSRVLADLQLLEFDSRFDSVSLSAGEIDFLTAFIRKIDARLLHSIRRLEAISSSVSRQGEQLARLSNRVPRPQITVPDPGWDGGTQAAADSVEAPPSECPANNSQLGHPANEPVTAWRCSNGRWCKPEPRIRFGQSVGGDVDVLNPVPFHLPEILFRTLEAEMKKREQVIQKMLRCNQFLASKEQDYEKRNAWYEHKMRLLKQDKRRRGETIGKLLRCIDDMKDGWGGGGGVREEDEDDLNPSDPHSLSALMLALSPPSEETGIVGVGGLVMGAPVASGGTVNRAGGMTLTEDSWRTMQDIWNDQTANFVAMEAGCRGNMTSVPSDRADNRPAEFLSNFPAVARSSEVRLAALNGRMTLAEIEARILRESRADQFP